MKLFEKRSVSLTNPPEWLVDSFGLPTYSNEQVTVERALTVPGILAAMTILCQDIASLPLILYKRLPRGKERANNNPHYELMHDAPNPEMTSYIFREIMVGHLLGWGNFYAQKIWDNRGVIRELYPLNPANMQVGRKDGQRVYLYQPSGGSQIAFTQEQILHIPSFGFDGMTGKSLIGLARNAIGLSMAGEKYGSRVFANDARPSVVVKRPANAPAWSSTASTNFRESWEQAYGGASNAGKVAVLEEGMDIATIGFPSKDAQYIETQSWTIQQFARVFRIPPHMLGDITNSTSWGTGIEQQEIGYLTHTLRPWLIRIEQGLNKDILLEAERKQYFYEHLVDSMLRTDVNARMSAYATAITNGIMTRNEVRERENLMPYEYGDDPLYPTNLAVAGDQPDPAPAPVAKADPNAEPNSDPNSDPNADPQTDPAPKRDITPLLMDAARRISKRETNELSGAVKRYTDKPEKFTAWIEEFYKRDYPTFILGTLQPLMDAGLLAVDGAQRFIEQLCESRGYEVYLGIYSAAISPEFILSRLQESNHD